MGSAFRVKGFNAGVVEGRWEGGEGGRKVGWWEGVVVVVVVVVSGGSWEVHG